MKHGEMLSMTNRSQTSQHGSTKRSLLPKTYWQWSLTSRYRIMERLCLSIEDHDRTRGDCRAPSSSSQRTHPRCLWYDRLHGTDTHSIHATSEGEVPAVTQQKTTPLLSPAMAGSLRHKAA